MNKFLTIIGILLIFFCSGCKTRTRHELPEDPEKLLDLGTQAMKKNLQTALEIFRKGLKLKSNSKKFKNLEEEVVKLLNQTYNEMVTIPAGEFTMGTDLTGKEDEKPAHRVYLNSYLIDIKEVSVRQYEICVNSKVCEEPEKYDPSDKSKKKCNYGREDRKNHPVNCVNWYQADKYCRWIGKRLPSEAEWEKAARGTREYFYSWGNKFKCKYACASVMPCDWRDSTCPVDSFSDFKSTFGLLNTVGNVMEWVYDWYDPEYYKHSPKKNPMGPQKGTMKVLRGGSFINSNANELRVINRFAFPPEIKFPFSGFRCARSLIP